MEIAILFGLLLLNGVFAMSEIAVVTARKTLLREWAEDGNHRAEAALALANEPSHFLSTIQVGITLVGIFAGAYGEATLSTGLSDFLSGFPTLDRYSDQLAFGIVVVAITYFSLIVGELVPKRLALHNPELIASVVAKPMTWLSRLAHPVVRVLSGSTMLLLRLLGSRPSTEPPVSEEEIRILMEQGTQAGIFEKSEQALVRNVLRLDERLVASLMTPRGDIVCLDLEDPLEENLRKISANRFSRYPVCKGGFEHIVGFVHTKEMLARQLSGTAFDLAQCVQEPLFVPETVSAIQLLETFKQSRIHAALVVDEYGEIQGLVTLNDVLGAIVGEIPAAEDRGASSMVVKRADGSWLIDGMLDTGALKELLSLDELPDEEEAVYHTLGGLMMTRMGRVPRVADRFEWRGYRFEIMDMDGKRVDKVLVSGVSTPDRSAASAPADRR
jgi:putative hemolysin